MLTHENADLAPKMNVSQLNDLYQNHTRIWSDSGFHCHQQTGKWRKVCILSDRQTAPLPTNKTNPFMQLKLKS